MSQVWGVGNSQATSAMMFPLGGALPGGLLRPADWTKNTSVPFSRRPWRRDAHVALAFVKLYMYAEPAMSVPTLYVQYVSVAPEQLSVLDVPSQICQFGAIIGVLAIQSKVFSAQSA